MNYVLKSAMQSFPLCFYIFASSLVVFSCLTLTLAAWGREGERMLGYFDLKCTLNEAAGSD